MAETETQKPAETKPAPERAAKAPAAKEKGTKGGAAAGGAGQEAQGRPNRLRRRFIWVTIWSFVGVHFLMFLKFFFPRTLFEPKTVFSVGTVSDFGLGVDTRFQQGYRIWVVRKPDRLFVIFARCTHLGCTPDWKEAENKFKCPCHGSGFDTDGVNFEGPAPRPMDRAYVELDPAGQIMVDIGRLYKCERGGRCEFDDPGAYLVT